MERFEGSVKPSSIEKELYEHDLSAQRIVEIPSNMQMRCDYDVRTDGQPVYMGFGARGLATSDGGWLLYKLTYDASDRIIVRQVAEDSWDNILTAVYS